MYRLTLFLWGIQAVRTKPLTREETEVREANWTRIYGSPAGIAQITVETL